MNAYLMLEEARGIRMVERDEQRAVRRPFSDHDIGFVVRVGRDADTLALAQRVEMESAMPAQLAAVGCLHDGTRSVRYISAEEVSHLHFADETNTLAVLFVGRWQPGFASETPQLRLRQVADGESGVLQLFLRQQCEKVGLILVFVGPFKEVTGAVGVRNAAGVVPGCHGGEAFGAGPRAENAEFHFPVAHDVGIRGKPAGVTVEQVGYNALLIVAHQIHDAELNAKRVADGPRVVDVLHPGAMSDDIVLVDPVFHVGPDDRAALPLQL